MSKSRDAVEDIRTIDTVTATANAALPKAGGALTGTVTNFTSTGIDDNATSTAVTIDASENVGIGSTPATDWHSNYSVLQVGGQADIWTHKAVGAGKALHISHNAEYDTGFKCQCRLYGRQHRRFTSARSHYFSNSYYSR